MRHSALVHFGEMLYNQLEDRWYHSHQVSKRLLLEMAELAQHSQVQFILATIAEDALTREMLEFARAQGLMAVDISVDARRPEYTNQPHDSHPSALANAYYAERIETFLRTEVWQKARDTVDREPGKSRTAQPHQPDGAPM
jgi:hypothetical protein